MTLIKKTSSFIALTLLTLLVSCKKEKEMTSFEIGVENSNLEIMTFNPPVLAGRDFIMDVNDDGYPDFIISSEIMGSPGGQNTRLSSISPVNRSYEISTISLTDTVRLCQSLVYDSIKHYIEYNNLSTYHCSSDQIGAIISIQTFSHPRVYAKGEYPKHSADWENNDLMLAYNDEYKFHWISWGNNYIVRGNWNDNNMKYMLFRTWTGSKYLHGWLKLSVNNYTRVKIHEYAIEKQ